jgi:mannose-6-phosphate isomerase-like protein (cupin superfamily)
MAILDVVRLARANEAFRRELATQEQSQLVLMTIAPGGEIGEEVHEGIDQLLFFVEGECEAEIGGETAPVGRDQVAVVPAGTRHNFRNTGPGPLRLFTVYAPPEHAPGTVHETKEDADAAEHGH